MKWIRTVDQSLPHLTGSVLTVGNFDGVHLGHQKLLKELVFQGKEYNVPSVVCTFKPHPRVLLNPGTPVHRLFDYKDQAERMEALGVDFLIEEKFTKDFSLMQADEFLDLYINRYFKPKHIVVGYDFNFGKDRSGGIDFLRDYCQKNKIGLTVVSALEENGQVVSSSVIRKLLEHGNLEQAEKFLGRKYYIRGPVRVGFKRGRQLGVPTANVSPDIDFIPRKGVYFSTVYWNDKVFKSITNIGYNPTFESTNSYLKVETHIFDFNQEIYGEQIKVELQHFHRDEMKFSSVDALKHQIYNDIAESRKFFQL
ncbi:MAG: bifunctional riboflavin kinase/FAD synthetase [Pseudobdellovibrio sp.]|nr:bifunctional riboflavin kinase/FAD synthetase [Pseudobdellovibrio sp.]